jgi:hypothetical protein
MLKGFLTCFLLSFVFLVAAQDLLELEKRHGFKNIKLESTIDTVSGFKFKKDFKEKDEFDAKLYTIDHPDYTKIGDVKIKEIEVKTYHDLIYEISVVAEKDPRLMKALESLFGKSEYDIKNETYFWKTDSLILKFKPQGKHHIEMLYISFVVQKKMKDDKAQKVDDIANDF